MKTFARLRLAKWAFSLLERDWASKLCWVSTRSDELINCRWTVFNDIRFSGCMETAYITRHIQFFRQNFFFNFWKLTVVISNMIEFSPRRIACMLAADFTPWPRVLPVYKSSFGIKSAPSTVRDFCLKKWKSPFPNRINFMEMNYNHINIK